MFARRSYSKSHSTFIEAHDKTCTAVFAVFGFKSTILLPDYHPRKGKTYSESALVLVGSAFIESLENMGAGPPQQYRFRCRK